MKEAVIRQACIEKLLQNGYVVSVPTRSRFGSNRVYWKNNDIKYFKNSDDIFTIFDCVAVKGNEIKFIQYTSISNISTRRNKMRKFLEEHKLDFNCEVWGYRGKNEWSIEVL